MNEEKKMIITGASSGVGEAVAKQFCGRGWRIFGIARNRPKLEAMAASLAGFTGHAADITDKVRLKEVFREIAALSGGAVDVLVNNAGATNDVLPTGYPRAGDLDLLDPLIDINLKGPIYCTYLTMPLMLPFKKGQIINISSIAGLPGGPNPQFHKAGEVLDNPTYSVAKAGLDKFAQIMGLGLMENGIRMTTINPGGIATPIWLEKNQYPGDTGKLMKPEELADLIEFIVLRPEGALYKNIILHPVCEWVY